MSGEYTTNINLFKTNMETDGNDAFNFDRDLNENWDKIDTLAGQVVKKDGSTPFTSEQEGIAPTSDNGLTTKQFVENRIIENFANCILEAPNGIVSYSGGTLTIKAGLKYIVSRGLVNNKPDNVVCTLQNDVEITVDPTWNYKMAMALTEAGTLVIKNAYIVSEDLPTKNLSWIIWYNTAVQKAFICDNGGAWVECPCTFIFYVQHTSGTIDEVRPDYPLDSLKRSDMENIHYEDTPDFTREYTIVNSGTADETGYIHILAANFDTSWSRVDLFIDGVRVHRNSYLNGQNGANIDGFLVKIAKGSTWSFAIKEMAQAFFAPRKGGI